MKRIYFLPVAALLLSSGIVAWRHRQAEETPIRTTGQGVPDAVTSGNVAAAMAQCKQVIAVLQQNNWDMPNPCPDATMKLLTLPDARFMESAFRRRANVTSIAVPVTDPETALFTDVYARQNRSYYKGDLSKGAATGFFIVGYKKTGEVKQIPVESVRMKKECSPGEDANCFPDQSCYPASVPSTRYSRDAAPH